MHQKRLQWTAHVFVWVASTYLIVEAQIVLLHEAIAHRSSLYVLARTESNMHTGFSLFVFSRLGMCDRLNSPVCSSSFCAI